MKPAVDTEMLDEVCERNSVDWIGTRSDATNTAVHMEPEVLAVPRTQTLFENTLGYRFIVDDEGVATAIVEIHVSGPYQYAKQP